MIAIMLTLLLLLILPLDVHDCCDVVEVNHVYNADGSLTFDQWICWTWNSSESRLDVRDWRLIHNARELCEADKRQWNKTHPDGPPYEPKWVGSPMVPEKMDGGGRLSLCVVRQNIWNAPGNCNASSARDLDELRSRNAGARRLARKQTEEI